MVSIQKMNDDCDFILLIITGSIVLSVTFYSLFTRLQALGQVFVFLNSKILFNNKYIANLMFGEGNGNPLQYSHLGNPWMGEPGGL